MSVSYQLVRAIYRDDPYNQFRHLLIIHGLLVFYYCNLSFNENTLRYISVNAN